jgi:hypothetical protein
MCTPPDVLVLRPGLDGSAAAIVQQTQLILGQVTGTRLFEALPAFFCTVFFDPHPLF